MGSLSSGQYIATTMYEPFRCRIRERISSETQFIHECCELLPGVATVCAIRNTSPADSFPDLRELINGSASDRFCGETYAGKSGRDHAISSYTFELHTHTSDDLSRRRLRGPSHIKLREARFTRLQHLDVLIPAR